MPIVETATFFGAKLAKREAEKLRNPEHRKRRRKQVAYSLGAAAIVSVGSVGGAMMVPENVKGYAIPEFTTETQMSAGEQSVVSTTIDLDKFCAVGYAAHGKQEAKTESKAKLFGIEGTYAHRLMEAQAEAEGEFCQKVTEAEVEYDPRDHTYDIYIPTESMSIATKINYGDGVNDTDNPFNYKPSASVSNLPGDLFDSVLRHTPLDDVDVLNNITKDMDKVNSFLLKSALMKIEHDVAAKCGDMVFDVVEDHYKQSVVSAAESFTTPLAEALGVDLKVSVYIGSQDENNPDAPQKIEFANDYDDEIAKLKSESGVIFKGEDVKTCTVPAELKADTIEGASYARTEQ